MIIEIFGMGCVKCKQLMMNVQQAVKELGVEAQVNKIEDFEMLIRRGITMTPGLVIDGEIRSMGRVPSVIEIKEMIEVVGKEKTVQPTSATTKRDPSCGCSGEGVAFYPCSGGSNVGQISNDAAKSLSEQGLGKFSCLAGIGSHGEGFLTNAKRAKHVVSLDGCASKCSYNTLRHAGIEPTMHIVVTELGIKKAYDQLSTNPEDVEKVVSLVRIQLQQ